MSGTLEGYALADNEHASEAERGNVRVRLTRGAS